MQKEKSIEEINREVIACTQCRLWKRRTNAVPGDGSINTRIMFIGEAPGKEEDLKGLPFVGAAGKFLDQLLNKAELPRNEVYITNVVKCRPPNNRDPKPDEIATCTELYLTRQAKIIQPKFLVMLGRHSAAYIFSKAGIEAMGITAIHGRAYRISPFGFPVVAIPMFHPAAALYNRKYKGLLEEDFGALRSQLEEHSY
jgi:uracil-DNA glycosylase family 4